MRSIKQFLFSLCLLFASASSQAVTNGELFTWAAAAYPGYFSGAPVAGRHEQYEYRWFPSGHYLAVDDDGGVFVLGPVSGQQILQVGTVDGFTASVAAWQATQPTAAYRSKLLIQAWKSDGTPATIQDFVDYTQYRINRWSMYQNYGVFPLGASPSRAQIGSDISPMNVDGTEYIAMDVPKNQSFYFTALWRAPVIGTVFMRADGEGAGYLLPDGAPQKLELPYHFALSEYQQVQRQLAGTSPSPAAQALLSQASAAIETARHAGSGSARAVAAYAALSHVMPLKERLVLDASAAWLASNGPRSDFDLNYEGFASWTDARFVPGYVAAKDAGFASVYYYVDWNVVSPSRGVYDFSVLDYQLAQARNLGFKLALNINRNKPTLPVWAQALGFDELKALYYENARAVVARYGSDVSLYYTSGELELETGGLTLEEATELARQSLAGARAAAPGMPFGYYASASAYVSYHMNPPANATSRSTTDFIAHLARQGVRHDFLGLQMQYGTTFAPLDLQRFQEVLQDTYKVARIPIYMGESGYSSMTEDYGIPAQFYWHDGLTRQSQYEWADGTLRILYAMPFVKGYYWVHLDADNDDRGSTYLSTLVGVGFVTAGGALKQVQSAFKSFTEQLRAMPAGRGVAG